MGQYIDKSALIAEIEKRIDSLISLSESCPVNTVAKSGFYAQAQTLEGIKNFIDTLEVKKFDIEKEIANQYESNYEDYLTYEEFADIAKHFFELGIKVAQKGE